MSKEKKNKGQVLAKVKLGLSSLISNGACVELGRNHSWIGAVTVGLLSVILAIIPIGVSRAWVNGSDFFSTPTYGYEVGLVQFEKSVSETSGVSIVVDHAHRRRRVRVDRSYRLLERRFRLRSRL